MEVGAGRRFCGHLWLHGYAAVPVCEVYVVLVSCRWLLKYIIYEILHRKERKVRKAMAVESFAVFAHFAVNQIIKPSPPFVPSLSRSPPSYLRPPTLHVG